MATELNDGTITLRPWRADDVAFLCRACQDEAIHRFIALPSPYSDADARAYVARTEREWADGSKAAFAVVEPTDGTDGTDGRDGTGGPVLGAQRVRAEARDEGLGTEARALERNPHPPRDRRVVRLVVRRAQ